MKINEEIKDFQKRREKEIMRKYLAPLKPSYRKDESSLDMLVMNQQFRKVALYWRFLTTPSVKSGKECSEKLVLAKQVEQTLVEQIESYNEWAFIGKYEDCGTGENDDENIELERLIADCEAGKVDLIVTQSLMSFTCNVGYSITLVSKLRSLEHPVFVRFENESVCSWLKKDDVFFTILLDVEEEETRAKMKKRLLAGSLLWKLLQSGPVEYVKITKLFSKQKISMSTVDEARKDMDVISYQCKGIQYWSLPESNKMHEELRDNREKKT